MGRGTGTDTGTDTGRGAFGGARTALAVVVVAGTGLGALVMRPGGDLARGTGPVRSGALVALIAVAWPACCLAVYARHRRQVRGVAGRTPAEQRLAAAVRVSLLAAAAAIPVLLVVLHKAGATRHVKRGERSVHAPAPPELRPGRDAQPLPPWLESAVLALAVVVLVGAFAYAYRRLRAEYVRKPRPAQPEHADGAAVLAGAVASGRRALRDIDDVRTGVIACYAAMEASLSASGVARHASDSPNDLLARAAAGGLRTGGSAAVLAELFREARYSTHPMGEDQRRQAAAALADLAAALGASPAETGSGARV